MAGRVQGGMHTMIFKVEGMRERGMQMSGRLHLAGKKELTEGEGQRENESENHL